MNNYLSLIVDTYTNLLHTLTHNNKLLLWNKIILNLKNLENINYINDDSSYSSKFTKHLCNFIKTKKTFYSVKVFINKIPFPSTLIDNKLIITLGILKNIIIYIPLIDKIKIEINTKDSYINISSDNLNYISHLAAFIKSAHKIDKCTRLGMFYSTDIVILKKRRKNDKHKK